MKKVIKASYASRDYVITIGALHSVCISNMNVKIYDKLSEEVVWDGYFNDALRQYPWLADCEVLHLQVNGPQKMFIETFVDSRYSFEPAW